MTSRIERLKERYVTNKAHHRLRQAPIDPYAQARRYHEEGLTDPIRASRRLRYVLEQEIPVVFPDERIVLLRTVPVLPELYTPEETAELKERFYIHEQGKVCNITPEYSLLLREGFDGRIRQIQAELAALPEGETEHRIYLTAMLDTLDAILAFTDRYRDEAIRVGNTEAAAVLTRVPRKPAQTLPEALQFLRILHYCLWASYQYHNTLGRFDQYMLPYLQHDRQQGMSDEEALELIEEFFLCCNKDSDLYTGMQQGDNGQSMVLGGRNPDGTDSYNALSEMCLTACGELRLIDPKINLRVHKDTPLSVYAAGTRLTKLGLGFPQYSNDDIIIPCLMNWGYEAADAYNYSIAACWEVIIPGYGMDIPNIAGLSFAHIAASCVADIPDCGTFEALQDRVRERIFAQVAQITDGIGQVHLESAPLMSLMMYGCTERGEDVSRAAKYNNYGIHGTGLATAVDSLAAIRKYVYEEKTLTAKMLSDMLRANFKGYDRQLHMLRCDAPKMGNNDDAVDAIATRLLDDFADAAAAHRNARGGIYRAGTGSAMYYVWHSREEGATPDGRLAGEAIPCNYSPSLFVRCRGPVSVVQSFAKPHLVRVANGGPLTIELHDSVFRAPDSIQKVAAFVKSFMDLGGHQMQINAVNADVLRDAKAHPEEHRNLIVRVWGWSGYFVELDEAYQNHILERVEMTM